MEDLAKLEREYASAVKAWNRDNGSHKDTILCGERLYFAAAFLIEALQEKLATK